MLFHLHEKCYFWWSILQVYPFPLSGAVVEIDLELKMSNSVVDPHHI